MSKLDDTISLDSFISESEKTKLDPYIKNLGLQRRNYNKVIED
jgi:hypothetical protein